MPVSISRLRELIVLASAPGVDGIDLIEDGTHIVITRNGDVAVNITTATGTESLATAAADMNFKAPMFGVFHITAAPGAKPFVCAGDLIRRGQQLCLIEAMKTFNAITSDRDGRIEAVLVEPGTEVSSGQPLFRIGPA